MITISGRPTILGGQTTLYREKPLISTIEQFDGNNWTIVDSMKRERKWFTSVSVSWTYSTCDEETGEDK
jgi:hypothetical protein